MAEAPVNRFFGMFFRRTGIQDNLSGEKGILTGRKETGGSIENRGSFGPRIFWVVFETQIN
ncbi:MAG: hypothetical protein DRH56_10140 [Deltaproteobacteria bacterium]|nr:MAG: hypothetical protein DRH56_10140 [Deltaproteobacteria bacterium]